MNTWYSMEAFAHDKQEVRLQKARTARLIRAARATDEKGPRPGPAWVGRVVLGARRALVRPGGGA